MVLLACSGINAAAESRATLVDCGSTREALFRAAQATERAGPAERGRRRRFPGRAGRAARRVGRRALRPGFLPEDNRCGGACGDGSNCGEVAYARWARCEGTCSGGAIAARRSPCGSLHLAAEQGAGGGHGGRDEISLRDPACTGWHNRRRGRDRRRGPLQQVLVAAGSVL